MASQPPGILAQGEPPVSEQQPQGQGQQPIGMQQVSEAAMPSSDEGGADVEDSLVESEDSWNPTSSHLATSGSHYNE